MQVIIIIVIIYYYYYNISNMKVSFLLAVNTIYLIQNVKSKTCYVPSYGPHYASCSFFCPSVCPNRLVTRKQKKTVVQGANKWSVNLENKVTRAFVNTCFFRK